MGNKDGLDPVKGDRASLFADTTSHDTSNISNTVAVECKYPIMLKSKFSIEKKFETISSTSECQNQTPQDPF